LLKTFQRLGYFVQVSDIPLSVVRHVSRAAGFQEGCQARLEAHHQMAIPREMLAAAVDLSVRYAPHRRLPDKAIDLLDEACACARLAPSHSRPIEERKE
jgi:ATP-dependent Clp protease ATP-binding subunit ClpA